MSEKKLKSFDLEAVYDAEISPLMTKIIAICREHKMPVFATFLYKNDLEEGDDGVYTTSIMFEKERPVPEKLINLARSIQPESRPALRMTVRKSDGSVEDTVIL